MASRRSASAGSPVRPLSLAENIVLCLVAEGSTHGFAIARVVAADQDLGRIFHIPRPIVYRALERLLSADLVSVDGVQASPQGPQRTRYRITRAGRRAVDRWLGSPVAHIRDIRTEFLAKLVLLERAEVDDHPLIAAQREVVAPIVEALSRRTGTGPDRVVDAWRYQTAQATLAFLDDLAGDRQA